MCRMLPFIASTSSLAEVLHHAATLLDDDAFLSMVWHDIHKLMQKSQVLGEPK